MERTTFLKNYRIRLGYDGSPHEPERNGSSVSYAAVDQRTAEPVSMTLISVEGIDPSEREQFEQNVSAALKLRHVNVAKVLDFGREDDDYVYVAERLAGETLASWVRNHGPMAADAALRVAEQLLSVLSSAGFHKLPYPSIQPGNIMLVPGQTPEGNWPLVKVTNFGLPALVPCPEPELSQSETDNKPAIGEPSATNQQFSQPTTDIRTEIYSLGVTLYALLTGVALSAEAREKGPKFSGFPKPLRSLLAQMLHRDPDRRPKDVLIVTELIRGALDKMDRRRALSDRYGIPLKTTVARQAEAPVRRVLLGTAVAFGVLLALAAAIAPTLFPDSLGKMLGLTHEPKPVGVLIGVPDSSPPKAAHIPENHSTTARAGVASQPISPTVASDIQAPTNSQTPSSPPGIRDADVQQAQIANAQPEAATPPDSVQNSAGTTLNSSPSGDTAGNATAQANETPPPDTSQTRSQDEKKSVTSTSKHSRAGQSSRNASRGRRGPVRS
ncbi:MAG TPA: hypothetical protein VE131_02095, partial [Terriglobales bacterium]|nr:hypothetical protein [Terriglobales bacterium]